MGVWDRKMGQGIGRGDRDYRRGGVDVLYMGYRAGVKNQRLNAFKTMTPSVSLVVVKVLAETQIMKVGTSA